MQKGPLIILGSARKESDTRKVVDKIFHGVDHTLIDLLDHTLAGYDYSHIYSEKDRYQQMVDEMLLHQTIVFATPVYWYSMSALMKTFFDRFSDLVTYKKSIGRQLKGKSTLLVAVGAEEYLPDGYEMPFKATSDYLDMDYLGHLYHCTKTDIPNPQLIDAFLKKILDK
ncbi:MAG TPA: NAD(P)H-dependent oxidoreductase [Chitinophagaceae bacterium]|nr:NAD(P)H-dependent oxidoreductase [Chitinophagaceae bacterium]